MNLPRIKTIETITSETDTIKTITFNDTIPITSGQFYMIWIPDIDEIPMSVSKITKTKKNITYKKIGDATNTLFNLKQGNQIGIRGPFGNGYTIQGNNLLFVGGGTGIAMLAPAIEQAIKEQRHTTVIIGAQNKKDIIFEKRFKPHVDLLIITTDDGSKGYKGFASDKAKKLIEENTYDNILTCGPEPMMKHLLNTCNSYNLSVQASLERYMKCALGICGQCTIGNGQRVCKEGPIFTGEQLTTFSDFGQTKRDATGRKIPI
jgi:dihydroorotate dehydrogenase electron transfer subunit